MTKPVTAAGMKSLTPRKTLLYVIMASIFAVSAIVVGVLLMSSFTGSGPEESIRPQASFNNSIQTSGDMDQHVPRELSPAP
jgi:hypothetical protein